MISYSGTHNDIMGKNIANWFSHMQGLPVNEPYYVIGWFKEDKPIAAALFNSYNGSSIEVHYYGPNSLNKITIKRIVNYVFVQLQCNTLIGIVPRNNNFKKYLERIGFKFLAVIPKYFGEERNKDGLFYYLSKEVAYTKWINRNVKCAVATTS